MEALDRLVSRYYWTEVCKAIKRSTVEFSTIEEADTHMPTPCSCRDCNAPVFWLRHNTTGNLMPINAEPDPAGNLVLVGDEHYCIVKGELFEDMHPGELYSSHFLNCPAAAARRKAKKAKQ